MDHFTQLKRKLIERIENSEDLIFLQALTTLIESSEENLFELSSEQENSIEIGRSQIAKGELSTHEDVMLEMKKLLHQF